MMIVAMTLAYSAIGDSAIRYHRSRRDRPLPAGFLDNPRQHRVVRPELAPDDERRQGDRDAAQQTSIHGAHIHGDDGAAGPVLGELERAEAPRQRDRPAV